MGQDKNKTWQQTGQKYFPKLIKNNIKLNEHKQKTWKEYVGQENNYFNNCNNIWNGNRLNTSINKRLSSWKKKIKIQLSVIWKRLSLYILSFPGGSDGKKASACNSRDPSWIPWFGKIPWRRKWQPTPVFSPGKFHRLRSLVGSRGWQSRTQLSNFTFTLYT